MNKKIVALALILTACAPLCGVKKNEKKAVKENPIYSFTINGLDVVVPLEKNTFTMHETTKTKLYSCLPTTEIQHDLQDIQKRYYPGTGLEALYDGILAQEVLASNHVEKNSAKPYERTIPQQSIKRAYCTLCGRLRSQYHTHALQYITTQTNQEEPISEKTVYELLTEQ